MNLKGRHLILRLKKAGQQVPKTNDGSILIQFFASVYIVAETDGSAKIRRKPKVIKQALHICNQREVIPYFSN